MHKNISIKREILIKGRKWPEQELNQRHKDFQSFALPTELSGQSRAFILRQKCYYVY